VYRKCTALKFLKLRVLVLVVNAGNRVEVSDVKSARRWDVNWLSMWAEF
jgi:hypothetical protein